MFEALLWLTIAIAVIGLLVAFDGSRDAFHPLVFIAPMMVFLYGWMPMKLLASGSLARFFDNDQLVHVQTLNVLGIAAFVIACLSVGVRVRRPAGVSSKLSPLGCMRLRIGGAIAGGIGLLCWMISIINVGGL